MIISCITRITSMQYYTFWQLYGFTRSNRENVRKQEDSNMYKRGRSWHKTGEASKGVLEKLNLGLHVHNDEYQTANYSYISCYVFSCSFW